jgi:hypothetical protein
VTQNTDALDAGIALAADPDPIEAQRKARDAADVKRWFEKIEQARKFDEEARKQYVRDRRYARGDSGFEVDANILGTFIDISESFLYARQPELEVLPARAMQPPGMDALRDAAELVVGDAPDIRESGLMAAQQAVAMGTPPEMAVQLGAQQEEATRRELVRAEIDRMRKAYQRRNRETKAYADTLDLVASRMWADADLKARGRRFVRSALTVGLGIIKASWQERTGQDPQTLKAINDLQDNIKRIRAQEASLEDESPGLLAKIKAGVQGLLGDSEEAKVAELERQVAALQGQVERVVARGYVADVVAPEDFVVPPGCILTDHCDAPWNAQRIPMLASDAQAEFGLTREQIQQATKFSARKPVMIKRDSAMVDEVQGSEADAYTTGQGTETGDWVMVWEIWDREASHVLTGIEGMKCWAKAPWQPKPTTRFYPFFLYAPCEVDGQRHPQSLVTRSAKLVDEYNRIGSAEAEHRRRVRPKLMFNAGAMDNENAEKLERGTTNEMVGVKTTTPKADLRGLLVPVTYAALDPGLYDRSRIVNELERIWGIQEALSGSIDVAKTATEAEIQQGGFQARIGGRRDLLEAALGDLARYTAEIARAYLDEDDVRTMAGPDAFWPAYEGPDDLRRALDVDIRAGSSGKPNTTAERNAWTALLPLLQQGIGQIAQLRGSSPEDVADCYERLMRTTAEFTGGRIDIDALIPPPGSAQPAPPGLPGAPPSPAGPALPPDPMAAPTPDPLQSAA